MKAVRVKADRVKADPRSRDRVYVYKASDGWRWQRVSSNGRIVADGGEAYRRKGVAISMAAGVNVGIAVEVEE